jgi:spermidine synthase
MLQIGLGIGSLPNTLKPHGIVSEVVEIDPAVVRFAQLHFGFSTTGHIFVEDARTFLTATDRKYDIIVHDTFTGGSTPEHLLSVEVIKRIREVLKPGGVLALNFVGGTTGAGAEASRLVASTLRSVFRTVRAFADSGHDRRPSLEHRRFAPSADGSAFGGTSCGASLCGWSAGQITG